MEAMDRVTEGTSETHAPGQLASTRTISNLFNASLQEGASSTIEILDPDVANTKGRPRMETIKEKIKKKKFYKCSHCGGDDHTRQKYENLLLVFNLPKKPKRTRKSKPKGAGNKKYLMLQI